MILQELRKAIRAAMPSANSPSVPVAVALAVAAPSDIEIVIVDDDSGDEVRVQQNFFSFIAFKRHQRRDFMSVKLAQRVGEKAVHRFAGTSRSPSCRLLFRYRYYCFCCTCRLSAARREGGLSHREPN